MYNYEPVGEFFYWGPLLYKTKVPFEIVSELLQRGKNSNIDFRPHLAGILEKESSYTYEDKEFFVRAIEPVLLNYKTTYEHWYNENIDDKIFELEEMWINFMYAGDCNPPHTHTGTLSFVLFLEIDPSLREEYDNFLKLSNKGSGPAAIHFLYGHSSPNLIVQKTFFPEVGDMYIFPSGLYHTVLPFKTKTCRISVAGNFFLTDRNSL